MPTILGRGPLPWWSRLDPLVATSPTSVHDEDVRQWLAAKRQALEAWIAKHTPPDDSPINRALATSLYGRYPGEVPMVPARGTAQAAVETLAPRSMADVMMLGASAAQRVIKPSAFVRVPEGHRNFYYERARQLAPDSALWADPVPQDMQIFRSRGGPEAYYGLSQSALGPGIKEIEMVSSHTPPEAIRDAVKRGGETSLLFGVPNETYPAGELPQRLDPHGFEPVWTEGFSTAFPRPSAEMQAAWRTQGWKPGDPLPPVQYMMHPATTAPPRTIPRYDVTADLSLSPAVRQARGPLPEASIRGVPVQTNRSTSPLVPEGARRPETVLEHRSPVAGLTTLDPAKFGTTTRGEEVARAAAYPEEFVPRVYATREGGRIEDRFRRLPVYEGRVPTDRLYDWATDPWGLRAEAMQASPTDLRRAATMYEQYIRDLGFGGYYDTSGPVPDAVAWFDPLAVRPRAATAVPGRGVAATTR